MKKEREKEREKLMNERTNERTQARTQERSWEQDRGSGLPTIFVSLDQDGWRSWAVADTGVGHHPYLIVRPGLQALQGDRLLAGPHVFHSGVILCLTRLIFHVKDLIAGQGPILFVG